MAILCFCISNIKLLRVDKKIGIDVESKEFVICSDGYRVSNPKHLRKWTCSNCGTKHDRDINTSINLEHLIS